MLAAGAEARLSRFATLLLPISFVGMIIQEADLRVPRRNASHLRQRRSRFSRCGARRSRPASDFGEARTPKASACRPVKLKVLRRPVEPTFADAILDRIVHNAHRIDLVGPSMRKAIAEISTPTRLTIQSKNDIKGTPNGDDHDAQFDPRPKWPFWIGTGGRFPLESVAAFIGMRSCLYRCDGSAHRDGRVAAHEVLVPGHREQSRHGLSGSPAPWLGARPRPKMSRGRYSGVPVLRALQPTAEMLEGFDKEALR